MSGALPGADKGQRLYDAASVYEEAFGFHDVSGEAQALLAWGRRALGREPTSIVELCCGPAFAGVELARLGKTVAALDLAPAMCERAISRARAAGVSLEVHVGDMNHLERVPWRTSYDMALCLTESLAHVPTVRNLVGHLRGVARVLGPRGVYVLEQIHPRWVIGPEAFLADVPWEIVRDGRRYVSVWGSIKDPWDPITQVRDTSIVIQQEKNGRLVEVFREQVALKAWTATEVEACVLASGVFELVERHGDFAPDALFDNTPESWRMISILRKT